MEKLWHKDYRPQIYIRGSRRSGRGDYWISSCSDGKCAVRVHLWPGKALFTSGISTRGEQGEPRLDLLGDSRTNHVLYDKSDTVISFSDDFRVADPAHRLPETRMGVTVFMLAGSTRGTTTPRQTADNLHNSRWIRAAITGRR